MLNRIRKWKSDWSCDASLLREFRAGDEGAFGVIYLKYRKPILKYVGDRVRDRDAGEDLVQEIFLKVHRFRESYDPKQEFTTWLWSVARNSVTDWQRKRRLEEPNAEAAEKLACSRPRADALLELKSKRRVLIKLIRHLTSPQRRVVWMRVVHQLSYEEIARHLDLSISAVKCLAYRSRQIMRQLGYSPAFAY